MITSETDVVFYIQASAASGMGHLVRSASVISSLDKYGIDSRIVLRVDDQGRALAQSKGLTERETELHDDTPAPDHFVIDAMNVLEEDAQNLVKTPQRILVSPVCDRADIATHAMLRTAPEDLRNRLAPDCMLTCDDRFAYVTAANLSPRTLDYDGPLAVGICLSGGSDQPEIDTLLRAALEASSVEAIYMIHPRVPYTYGSSVAIYNRVFCDDPWSFFDPINVFVGGDGVMIAEAVAQAIPCMSLTLPGAPFKNPVLVSAGSVETCPRSDAPTMLTAMLSDRARLKGMHRAALAQGGRRDASALPRAIVQLIKNSGG